MKFKKPMLVVNDMEKSKIFYKDVLRLRVIMDFGANVTLTGGVTLQTKESWKEFIQKDDNEISFNGNNSELYFEEDNFDSFINKLTSINCIEYVHDVYEHKWGQRVVRFYDLDKHIIEVGENLKTVCKRFLDSELNVEETAKRMDVPVKFVQASIK
ncbi:catechol 2,3-dioxygenase-like lactoylglutathione lyase family enzyme [Clostridium saccharoperbutylacetonicum]|uniref:Glyoxalase/bleomycin resistance protein/dioxygenase n=1 Tax=Clostridium saccharoperbutylacetonicum N1-4(HMT) TaxID=931276 RepID=M1LSZ3_9CLOT|nr:VOC family protein [Clostridium saccharoperbutylacetonicum]AGF56135.1 glyoxalase/bleomycin resistance protein/dioxygenase [Clostridium saccharoperbutylacetonicum N1-4(HMT)]NRT63124.1 catechol 2,3-dioxygenase-like lactoylglutathione lyase family enzyme [Clostridium saccharoperbutylacetonicum]NSB26482.1 catechol 2,3-dioxygenase-like lactoylglutathione lyase family enzyme [Clostridium saccharoperbutylacetonicum]NSB45834.1 catechol 2,3-dioxygenase-like lactoylglutathione lyase family enzyme [Clo